MIALDTLDTTQAALAAASAEVDRLRAAAGTQRAATQAQGVALTALEAEHRASAVAAALGGSTAPYRARDLSAARADFETAEQVEDEIARLVEAAERAVVAREREHASALAAVATTLEPDLRRAALDGWEAAARAHVTWLDVAARSGARCTGAFALLGDGDDRIGELLQSHGVDPMSYTRIGGAFSPTRPASEAALRALAMKTT